MSSSLPPSPPSDPVLAFNPYAVETAARVLRAQGEAITALSHEFSSENWNNGPAALFCHSLTLIQAAVRNGGKVVFSGMGKSYKIGSKLVATLHSFGISAAALHPSDALHGDVGLVHNNDIVVLISASGKSPELMALLRHLPSNVPTVCLTCVTKSPLAEMSTGIIVAPIESRHSELALYGMPAPTITTTMCLTIGDAMCVALHESLVEDEKARRSNFQRWHPGGAIGIANGNASSTCDETVVTLWSSIPQLNASLDESSVASIWRAVALSPYILAGDIMYKSAAVITALEAGRPLVQLRGQNVLLAPRTRCHGLCVFRDENNQPTGMIWDD